MSKALLAFAAITTIVLLGTFFADSTVSDDASRILFKNWMQKHGRSYATEEEFVLRMGRFMANAKYVAEHNARYFAGLETFDLELNLFADLNTKEFADRYLMKNFKVTKNCTGPQAPSSNLPTDVDWSAKGAVTPIKNQGQCGSCWAFSTTGSLEGARFLKDRTLESYSEQQLVDCSHTYGNNGCNGGLMDDAFFYVIDNGITLESKYPYKAVGATCKYTATDKAWQISNCADVTVDKELPLQAAVAQQPVSVAIEANHASFQLYKSGVYSGNCGTSLDHGVLNVGYGVDGTNKYWKVKNSWGATWGLQGYIHIVRKGDGKGQCGINMAASFPIA